MKRSYEAHLWEDPTELEQTESSTVMGDLSSDATVQSHTISTERVYEDPEYLKQYVVHWDDSAGGGKTMSAEYEAFLIAAKASYLSKVASRLNQSMLQRC